MSELAANSGPFRAGDRVQLTGPKNRLHTITLIRGNAFHTQHGFFSHEDLIGLPDASVVKTSGGVPYLAMRPLLKDYVMSMPRGAAIIYPKDSAQIVSLADIFPGSTVVEAGVGSGALSLSLLRAVGDSGKLVSFERRAEFAEIAKANVTTFHGETPENWEVVLGDLSEELPKKFKTDQVDRVVLDMLAPWECLAAVQQTLVSGGVLLCYLATVTQVSRLVEAIRDTESFTDPETSETLNRGWHVEGLAVRPDHRMVAHTGFLVVARKLAPGTVLPKPKRRASKESYSEEDLEHWTPDSVGQSEKSAKRIRKNLRTAVTQSEHKTRS